MFAAYAGIEWSVEWMAGFGIAMALLILLMNRVPAIALPLTLVAGGAAGLAQGVADPAARGFWHVLEWGGAAALTIAGLIAFEYLRRADHE